MEKFAHLKNSVDSLWTLAEHFPNLIQKEILKTQV